MYILENITMDDFRKKLRNTMIIIFPYLSPETVKRRSYEEYPKIPKPFIAKDKLKYLPGRVWKNPRKASMEKGRKAMRLITDEIVEVLDKIEKKK